MNFKLKSIQTIISWIAQLLAATIMFQTLFFKFTGAEESIYIFTKIGMEPVGRYGSGIAELITSLLLLVPTLCWIGAIIGTGVMAGAIVSHLTLLGISVKDDGGYLFMLALITFVCCLTILFIRKHQIPVINKLIS